MGLFDKLRKAADEPAGNDAGSQASAPQGDRADLPRPTLINLAALTDRSPTVPPGPLDPPPPSGERYDSTHPSQAPVSGIDLITFAAVTRQLLDTPVEGHASLLRGYGHSSESWSAVNTAWMARLGQMPFLYEAYDAAYRSA